MISLLFLFGLAVCPETGHNAVILDGLDTRIAFISNSAMTKKSKLKSYWHGCASRISLSRLDNYRREI